MNISANNKNFFLFSLLVIFFILIFTISTASAATNIYVNGTSGNDNWDGTSPTYTGGSVGPKKSINNASKTVDDDGAVRIANGIYKEHDITINKNMALIGESREGTVVDAQYLGRIFVVSTGITVELSNLKLINGQMDNSVGGAVYNKGSLTITNCNLTNNKAYFGGALYNVGHLSVINCIFTSNKAPQGGAIYTKNSIGTVYLNGNTFNNNEATTYGGAICSISNNLTLNNNAFLNNKAPSAGAVVSAFGSLDVYNCTFINNEVTNAGGAIVNSKGSLLTILTTFDGNTANGNGGAIYSEGGSLTVKYDNNFIGNRAVNRNGGAIFNQNSVGTVFIYKNSFTNNTSKAGGGTIINSNSYLSIISNTFTDNSAIGNGGVIYNLNSPLTFKYNNFTKNKAPQGGVIYTKNNVDNVGTVYFYRNTYKNNEATTYGGAICSIDCYLLMYSDVFIFNKAPDAGAVVSAFGTFQVFNSTFINNTATGAGGCIVNSKGSLIVKLDKFIDNMAINGFGGAVYSEGGPLTIYYNNFTENSAPQGGAVYNENSPGFVNFFKNTFTGNVGDRGAAIYWGKGISNLESNTFIDNKVAFHGGAIYIDSSGLVSVDQSKMSLLNCTFSNNTANGVAGAIYNNGALNTNNCTFIGNTATVAGGGIGNAQANVNVTKCIFTDNKTNNKGGAIYSNYGNLKVTYSNFKNNTGLYIFYKGIYYYNTNVTIQNNNFS